MLKGFQNSHSIKHDKFCVRESSKITITSNSTNNKNILEEIKKVLERERQRQRAQRKKEKKGREKTRNQK